MNAISVALVFWCGLVGPARETAGKYSFELDGKPFEPWVISLRDTPERIQADDLMFVHDTWMPVGTEKHQAFRSTPEEDGRLLQVLADGKTRVAGVTVTTTLEDPKPNERAKFVRRDPLATMSAEEIRGLRSVRLEDWTDETVSRLQQVDPQKVCVTLVECFRRDQRLKVPRLPAQLQYLRVEDRSNMDGFEDYSGLLPCKSLKCLIIHSYTGPVDCTYLRNAGELEYLELHAMHAAGFAALASLSKLRHLNLGYVKDLSDIGFARSMRGLATLDVQNTSVKDLTPLAGLAELRTLRTNQAPVERLPHGPLPALRMCEILSSKLSDGAVAVFAQTHPDCTVRSRWDKSLAQALREADRVRVRSGGTCHRIMDKEKVLFEEKDPAKVRQIVGSIAINEPKSGFQCMCCGDPSLEFYQKGTLLLTVGYHHGRSIRWPGVWPGDGLLTEASAKTLNGWLADHGIDSKQP